MEQLKKRGRQLASTCPLCGKEEESLEHLLLHCTKVYNLWAFIFTIFGVSWVLPCSIKEALAGWTGSLSRKSLKKVWMTTPLCLVNVIDFLDLLVTV